MTRPTLLLGAVAFMAHAGSVQAAEDPSAHRHQRDDQPTASELAHVPPPPPEHPMHDMSNEAMIELMDMDDTAAFGMVLLDQFEWRGFEGGNALFWDGQAWYGNDYDKLWFKMEAERTDDENESSVEALWDRVIGRWWSAQVGARQDLSEGPSRTWAGFGVQGLAPHWFEVEATVYVGEEGRSAARFTGEYEMLLTQRLILQPKIELNFYGKEDPENGIGSGLSSAEIGVRLRYEIRRRFAPYIGLSWSRQVGESARFARVADREVGDLQFVAGLRAWF